MIRLKLKKPGTEMHLTSQQFSQLELMDREKRFSKIKTQSLLCIKIKYISIYGLLFI